MLQDVQDTCSTGSTWFFKKKSSLVELDPAPVTFSCRNQHILQGQVSVYLADEIFVEPGLVHVFFKLRDSEEQLGQLDPIGPISDPALFISFSGFCPRFPAKCWPRDDPKVMELLNSLHDLSRNGLHRLGGNGSPW